jgi:hypothetical protein
VLSSSGNLALLRDRDETFAPRWQIREIQTDRVVFEHTSALLEAAMFAPGETSLAGMELQPTMTSSRDETFYRPVFWDFATGHARYGEPIGIDDQNYPSNLAFSRDGHSLYALFARGAARWDAATGKLESRFAVGGALPREPFVLNQTKSTLQITGKSKIYAQATPEHLEFWDLDSGQRLLRVPPLPKEKPVEGYASDFTPFSESSFSFQSQVVVIIRRYTIPVGYVYDAKSGRELWRVTLDKKNVNCWITPDGQEVIAVTPGHLEVRGARDGAVHRQLPAWPEMGFGQITGDWLLYLDGKSNLLRQRLR